MAADRLEVARRKRAAGEARVARAESEVRAAKYALLPLLADERYGDRDEWELSAEFVIVSYREPDTLSDADAAFIAAARTAVPRLLAEREALRAEVDRLSGLRLVDSVAAQAEEVASLTVERDRALGTIRIMLGDAAAEGRCGCAALYDGPQEDCPLHGRDYAWWVGSANQAYADLERLRGECRAVHPTNSTVVPCCLAAGHPEAEHMSTTGCAGSVMHWPTAEAELADARETIARLNARAQVAEAAIAELTGTGKGKAKRVAREIWTRCEESHGLACGTTRRARDFAARVEAENARLSEGVERLSSKIYKLRREAMDDLMALDRVLYAKACELFDNPKEAE